MAKSDDGDPCPPRRQACESTGETLYEGVSTRAWIVVEPIFTSPHFFPQLALSLLAFTMAQYRGYDDSEKQYSSDEAHKHPNEYDTVYTEPQSLSDPRDVNHSLHRGLSARQVTMIAIGGAIGTGRSLTFNNIHIT